jgi:hypothetical protein
MIASQPASQPVQPAIMATSQNWKKKKPGNLEPSWNLKEKVPKSL